MPVGYGNLLQKLNVVQDAVSPDDQLLAIARAAARGDAAAARTLILEVGGPMLRTVRRILGSHHPDAEDVTQEAVLGLLERLPDFRAECTVLTFAQRIALLRALSARRHGHRHPTVSNPEVHTEDVAENGEVTRPDDELASKRRRDLLLSLLDRLPEATAEALALHFVMGHTAEEVATLTGVPVNTVWSRLRLGKQALRRTIESDEVLTDKLVPGAR